MQQLFLCHYRGDAHEVQELATILRLYGVRPWLDSEGGFLLGDSFVGEARRAIQQDCFGMIFYATPEAFERPFIRRIELNEAIQRQERDPDFVFITILRRMTIPELSKLSRQHLGVDLSLYHAHQLQEPDNAQNLSLTEQLQDVASRILSRVLKSSKHLYQQSKIFSLQFSTRDLLPEEDEDILTIDATQLFLSGSTERDSWNLVETALFTIKQQISKYYGRPRLRVHGNRHLTAAALFGYVFRASSGFQIEVRQRTESWSTDCEPVRDLNVEVHEVPGSYHTDTLFVQVSATGKPVGDGVRRYVQTADLYPAISLSFTHSLEPCGIDGIDNATCCALARTISHRIATILSQNEISEIHLFAAVPQALAMMIGYQLNALRSVQLYEYLNGTYHPSYRTPTDGR